VNALEVAGRAAETYSLAVQVERSEEKVFGGMIEACMNFYCIESQACMEAVWSIFRYHVGQRGGLICII
jgi:hypothetical protein